MILSGDVIFENKNLDIELNYYKYNLANKIFFDYYFDELKTDKIKIEYIAEIKSFFIIQYTTYHYNS